MPMPHTKFIHLNITRTKTSYAGAYHYAVAYLGKGDPRTGQRVRRMEVPSGSRGGAPRVWGKDVTCFVPCDVRKIVKLQKNSLVDVCERRWGASPYMAPTTDFMAYALEWIDIRQSKARQCTSCLTYPSSQYDHINSANLHQS